MYQPPVYYPYAVGDTDEQWHVWWQTVSREWRQHTCGYDNGSWECTLPKGHQCRHVGHVSSGRVCGRGPEALPPELRVSEGL